MAVLEVNLLFTGRSGKDGLDHHRTYSRTYEVITDDPNDDEQVVGNAVDPVSGTAIPRRGTPFAPDPAAVVTEVTPQQSDDSPLIWHVRIEYDTDPRTANSDRPDRRVDFDGHPIGDDASGQAHQANPLDEPAQWTLTSREGEEPVQEWREVDASGTVIVPNPSDWAPDTVYQRGKYIKNGPNVYLCVAVFGTQHSAGAGGPTGTGSGVVDNNVTWDFYATYAATQSDPNSPVFVAAVSSARLPYDPPATTEVSKPVLSVTKNMPVATLEYLLALKNAVNRFVWRGVPPRCAKVRSVTHDGGKEKNGFFYVTTKWEIELDTDTFDSRLLDCGYGYLATRVNPATGLPETKYTRFVDADGNPLDQPVPLDGDGQPLEPGDQPVFRRGVPRQTKIIDFNTVLPF